MAVTRSLSDQISDVLNRLSKLSIEQLAQAKKALETVVEEITAGEEKNFETAFKLFLTTKMHEVGELILATLELDKAVRQELYTKAQISLFEEKKKKKLESLGVNLEAIHESVIWDGVTDGEVSDKVTDREITESIGGPEITKEWLKHLPKNPGFYDDKMLAKISLLAEWLNEKVRKFNQTILGIIGEMVVQFSQLENHVKEKRDALLQISDKLCKISKEANEKAEPFHAQIKQLNERKLSYPDEKEKLDEEAKKINEKIKEINQNARDQIIKLESKYENIREQLNQQVEKILSPKELNRSKSLSSLFKFTRSKDKADIQKNLAILEESEKSKLKRLSSLGSSLGEMLKSGKLKDRTEKQALKNHTTLPDTPKKKF